jgi:formylglycine-generating enzyme required for sulfatase activity
MSELGDALRLLQLMGRQHAGLPQALAALGFDAELLLAKQDDKKVSDKTPSPSSLVGTDILPEASKVSYQGFPVVLLTDYQQRNNQVKQPIQSKLKQFEPLVFNAVDFIGSQQPASLWNTKSVRNALLQHLSRINNTKMLDVSTLTNKIATRQSIKTLPYHSFRRLPGEIWLYLDMSAAGLLHSEDFMALYQILQTQLGKTGINQIVELLDDSQNSFEWRISHNFDLDAELETGELPVPPIGSQCIIVAGSSQLKQKNWRQLIQQLNQQQVNSVLFPLDPQLATTAMHSAPLTANRLENEQDLDIPLAEDLTKPLAIVLAALSLTPRWISLAMIRDLRLSLTDASPELEPLVVNLPGLNWSWSDQLGEWDQGYQKHQEYFKTQLADELKSKAIVIIQQHLPSELETLTHEHKMFAYCFSRNWASSEQGKAAKEDCIAHFQGYASRIAQARDTDEQLEDLQWLLAQAIRFQGIIPEGFSSVTRCFTMANLLWQQQTGSKQQLAELDPALWAEYQKDQTETSQQGAIFYQQGQLILGQKRQREAQSVGVKLVELKDIKNVLLPSGSALKVPAIGQKLEIHTTEESLILKTLSSQSFYWAKSLSVTSNGVVACTDFIQVSWPSMPQLSKPAPGFDGAVIEVLDNAPDWLHSYPPKLDQYGLYVELAIDDCTFKLRYIPPGSFLMGSPEHEPEREDNETQHGVKHTRGYWLGETTVTQALWQTVMGNSPSHFKAKLLPIKKADYSDYFFNHDVEQLPVESVNWHDCKEFCRLLNKSFEGLELSLPSEAQWEYACRAATQTPFSTGQQLTTDQANYDGDYPYHIGDKGIYREKSLPVDAFEPNGWGLQQMHGNVWEWCLDEMRDYPNNLQGQVVLNPVGELEGRKSVLRGGSFFGSGRLCRSAYRIRSSRDDADRSVGLRVSQVEPASE